ncbi:something about silencing protein 10-like [Penaeus chinensis]|uniref:something about silencing protein 10-like n=1 Tax=Penaeus chinensis TaxID=139456 RepID=UPI001FB699F3|nr:something about silencing protein 10-like [Penaeus chinensis]
MGKRRKMGGGGGGKGVSKKQGKDTRFGLGEQNAYENALIDPSSRGYVYDEVDDFEDEKDKNVLSLTKRLMARNESSKEQVLGIDSGSSEEEFEYNDTDEEEEEEEDGEQEEGEDEDEDELYMDDDIEDEDEERLPDDRAWGNKKWRYIGTDTSDERIQRKLYRQDEELAKLEEETARKLQDRMAAELEDLAAEDLIPQEEDKGEDDKSTQVRVETDISGLSKAKKMQLLKRESPEFLPLIEDMKSKCNEIQTFLRPLMKAIQSGQVPDGPAQQYIVTKYQLLLNYLSVLSVYMMVKSSQSSVSKHPVVGRLAQYRQLLQELEQCDEKLKPRLEKLLKAIKDGHAPKVAKKPIKQMRKLQILSGRKQEKAEEKGGRKRARGETTKSEQPLAYSFPKEEEEEDDEESFATPGTGGKKRKRGGKDKKKQEVVGKVVDPETKRSVNYEISKNKGLTAYRKKELQNPRVQYKKKYQAKLKKRRGQVQQVKKELNRYDGETTGIKAYTVKSRKLK